MADDMKSRFRLFQRGTGIFFSEDRATGVQASLRTRDPREAERLINARNEAQDQPGFALQMARTYLAAADPTLTKRTWRFAIEELINTKHGENALRWQRATKDRAYKKVLDLPIIETRADHLLGAVGSNGTIGVSVPMFYRVLGAAATNPTTNGMALIPAGTFTMGDSLDGEVDAIPNVTVNVSAFYMDVNLVSYSQWLSVYSWATEHGYGFVNAGSGKAANHPVQTVDWYDCVKWCNARSQQAGETPVYFTDAGLTQVYTSGEVTPYLNWSAKGYRLPTEAEWEKAARGGLSGQRFPWGNVINESLANYYGKTVDFSYDLGPNGLNAAFASGAQPYTSPVGYFAANGYGLYDMAGNVFEWCWDWIGTPYAGGTDPRGPESGSYRVLRGGNWGYNANDCRAANRFNFDPAVSYYGIGFRSVLPSGQ